MILKECHLCNRELLKVGEIATRRRKFCMFCICAGFELTNEEKRKLEEAKSKEVPMDEANKDGKMKAVHHMLHYVLAYSPLLIYCSDDDM
jgi:hypothetical protein